MKYLAIILALLFASSVHANLIVNELLANEPGGFTTLEWIELFNDSDSSLELSEYLLVVNSDTLLLPAVTVPANSYQLICRKLFAPIDESSFEAYWGDGSQVWGDSDFESKIREPIEISFSLPNDKGEVLLLQQENIVSTLNWETNSDDGFSWERKFVDSSLILQSKSQTNSTPGYINSVTLVEYDIAIEMVSVFIEGFKPFYRFQITNRGLGDINDGVLYISDSTTLVPMFSFQVPSIASDTTIEFEISFAVSSAGMYQPFIAIIESSTDLRSSNDSLFFTAVSQSYPPLIVSEFLANPQQEKETEWIEIQNRSSEIIDLQNWLIGDALKLNQIAVDSIYLAPNQYLVLTKSRDSFLFEYPLFGGTLIELASWAGLNNDSDKIRLQYNFGILADNYFYNSLYDSNYTVGRDIINETYTWGRSSEQYGTPGIENKLFNYHVDENVEIRLSSKYISPDGDGFEDNIIIAIDVPLSESYTLKLYDINGNVAKTFFEEREYVSNNIVWDGFGDNNARLRVGIYILYLTTDFGKSAKETIVIAR